MTRRLLYEVHESLLLQDWEYHDYRPSAAEAFVAEDLVVLKPEAVGRYPAATEVKVVRRDGEAGLRVVQAIFGEVTATDSGVHLVPRSPGTGIEAPLDVPAQDIDRIERGSVFTFTLRQGMRWHPRWCMPTTPRPLSAWASSSSTRATCASPGRSMRTRAWTATRSGSCSRR
ncbi:MAG: hypothetical protein R3F49_22700 [Planctomycetota bacterium]